MVQHLVNHLCCAVETPKQYSKLSLHGLFRHSACQEIAHDADLLLRQSALRAWASHHILQHGTRLRAYLSSEDRNSLMARLRPNAPMPNNWLRISSVRPITLTSNNCNLSATTVVNMKAHVHSELTEPKKRFVWHSRHYANATRIVFYWFCFKEHRICR